MYVDEQSVHKARRLVKDLTDDVRKLVETTQRVNLGGFGGVGGGGGFRGNTTVTSGPAAASNAAGTATNNATDNLIQTLTKHKEVFRSIATGSKDAMKVMDDAMRSSVQDQKQQIRDLQNSIKSLSQSYKDLGQFSKSLEGIPGQEGVQRRLHQDRQGMLNQIAEQMVSRSKGEQNLATLRSIGIQQIAGRSGQNFVNPKLGLFQRAFGMRQTNLATGQTSGGVGDFMRRRRRLPFSFGAGVVGATGLWALHTGVAEELREPTDILRQHQTLAGFGSAAVATRAGDYTTEWTLSHMDQADMAGLKRILGGGQKFARYIKAIEASPGNWAANLMDLPAQQKAAAMKYITGLKAKHPLTMQRLREASQTAEGRVAEMRATGLGDSYDKVGNFMGNASNKFVDKLTTNGAYTRGQVLAAFRQEAAAGGRGTAQHQLGGALYAQAGGFHNAGGFAGIMAMGGLSPDEALNRMGSITGPRKNGGVDVEAVNKMGDVIMQQMLNGTPVTTGTGMMGMFGGRAWQGGNAAQDMKYARFAQQGMDTGTQFLKGGPDAYQHGLNLLLAIKHGKGLGIYAQNYLAGHLNMNLIAQAMSGGKLPAEMAARGITRGMISGMGRDVLSSFMMRRLHDGDPRNKLMNTIQKDFGGDVVRFLHSKHGKELNQDIVSLGTAFHDTMGMGTEMGDENMMRMLATIGDYSHSRKWSHKHGRGFYDPSSGSASASAAKQHARAQQDLDVWMDHFKGSVKTMTTGADTVAEKLNDVASDLSITAGQLTDSLVGITAAFKEARSALESGKSESQSEFHKNVEVRIHAANSARVTAKANAKLHSALVPAVNGIDPSSRIR